MASLKKLFQSNEITKAVLTMVTWVVVGSLFGLGAVEKGLKVGDGAPEFSLPGQDGKTYALRELRGKKVVIYFYPKDATPGCTTEACAFRDSNTEILAKGAVVLGINGDSLKSHQKFAEKHRLNFPLLSDEDKKIVKAYGANGVMGITRRITYIINTQGKIGAIFLNVDPSKHAQEIIKA